MEVEKIIQQHARDLQNMGVRRMGLFGSVAREEATEASDVDILVEFEEEKKTYDNFFEIHELLECELGMPIDLVTDASLSPHFGQRILDSVHYVEFAN